MSDPTRLRDEAVVTLHELLDLGVRAHFVPSLLESSSMTGLMKQA
jgi:hypothetical protein